MRAFLLGDFPQTPSKSVGRRSSKNAASGVFRTSEKRTRKGLFLPSDDISLRAVRVDARAHTAQIHIEMQGSPFADEADRQQCASRTNAHRDRDARLALGHRLDACFAEIPTQRARLERKPILGI